MLVLKYVALLCAKNGINTSYNVKYINSALNFHIYKTRACVTIVSKLQLKFTVNTSHSLKIYWTL